MVRTAAARATASGRAASARASPTWASAAAPTPTAEVGCGPPMIPRYSRPELTELWSDGSRYELWLRVELAACEAMEAEGTVPAGTAAQVRSRAAGKLDAARI